MTPVADGISVAIYRSALPSTALCEITVTDRDLQFSIAILSAAHEAAFEPRG
jgi:hypothetical protein